MLSYKILLITVIIAVTINQITCGVLCRAAEEGEKSGEDGDVSTFFKNAGCTLEKGAKKVAEGAKSVGSTVKEGAKKFGSSVKEKYHELKDKISGDDTTTAMPESLDVRNVPLAPYENNGNQVNQCPQGQHLDSKGICHPI